MPYISFICKFIHQQTLVLAILLFTSMSSVCAQKRIYTHFEAEDEFHDCEIYHVMEDSKGKIWFSTDQGAIVYDGSKFERITSKEGLPDNTVFECYEDFKGRIWFVSYSFQLSYYENGNVVVYKFNDLIQEKMIRSPLYNTRSFFVDNDETVHVGSSRSFYITIDKKGGITDILKKGKNQKGNYCIQKDNKYIGSISGTEGMNVKKVDYVKEKDRINFFSSKEETFTLLIGNPKPQKILELTVFPVHFGDWYFTNLVAQLVSWKLDDHSTKTENRLIFNNATSPMFLKAIETVLEGSNYFDKIISKALFEVSSKNPPPKSDTVLTSRELEILKMICTDFSHYQIAEELCISPRTVEGHTKNLRIKLNVRSTAGMVQYAYQNGLMR